MSCGDKHRQQPRWCWFWTSPGRSTVVAFGRLLSFSGGLTVVGTPLTPSALAFPPRLLQEMVAEF